MKGLWLDYIQHPRKFLMLSRIYWALVVIGIFSCACPTMASENEVGQEIYRAKKSIVVNTNCQRAWNVVSDFSGIAKWYSGFSNSQRVDGNEGQVGEVRELLRSSNRQVVREKLIYINKDDMELAYTHTHNGPVKESIAIVSMTNLAGGQCLVSWANTMKLRDGQDPINIVQKFNASYEKVLEDLGNYLK